MRDSSAVGVSVCGGDAYAYVGLYMVGLYLSQVLHIGPSTFILVSIR